MKVKIVKFLVDKDKLAQELKEWVKNKSISLDERWEVFIESDLGIHKGYIERFDCKLGEYYIDSLEDKYSHHSVQGVLNSIGKSKSGFTDEEIIEYKENVLNSFIKSFEFDW